MVRGVGEPFQEGSDPALYIAGGVIGERTGGGTSGGGFLVGRNTLATYRATCPLIANLPWFTVRQTISCITVTPLTSYYTTCSPDNSASLHSIL